MNFKISGTRLHSFPQVVFSWFKKFMELHLAEDVMGTNPNRATSPVGDGESRPSGGESQAEIFLS